MIIEKFEDFCIEKRGGKVMLSAPHCYDQWRHGKIKRRETRSGVLVKSVASNLRCSCIYKTKFFYNDPNWDDESTYRAELVNFIKKNEIKCLLDIHTMRAERETDICIGTNCMKNIHGKKDMLDVVWKWFKDYGFQHVEIDKPFNASHHNVVSCDVAEQCKIPCFQIEINNRFMHKAYEDFDFDKVKRVVKDIVNELEKILDNKKT